MCSGYAGVPKFEIVNVLGSVHTLIQGTLLRMLVKLCMTGKVRKVYV